MLEQIHPDMLALEQETAGLLGEIIGDGTELTRTAIGLPGKSLTTGETIASSCRG